MSKKLKDPRNCKHGSTYRVRCSRCGLWFIKHKKKGK